jgi:hypothetical protein
VAKIEHLLIKCTIIFYARASKIYPNWDFFALKINHLAILPPTGDCGKKQDSKQERQDWPASDINHL